MHVIKMMSFICLMMSGVKVYTPNGDGKNDTYRPITGGASFTDYHLLIYSRWGELMFESYDFRGSWDGRYKGGDMPVGTYMYICTVTCAGGDQVFKGDIMLIR